MNRFMMFVMFFTAAALCYAQGVESVTPVALTAPIVIQEAKATLFTPPTHAEFLMETTITGDTMENAMQQALDLRGALQEKLQECQLHPTETTFLAPEIVDMENRGVRTAVLLRFSLTGYTTPDNGATRFAAICDGMLQVAAALNGHLSMPRVIIGSEDELLRRTIEAAVAEAFPGADAVANVLNSTIYAVEKVEILEITWNSASDREKPQSALTQTSCTARVRVTYAISPRS